jgi:hypothetical protein
MQEVISDKKALTTTKSTKGKKKSSKVNKAEPMYIAGYDIETPVAEESAGIEIPKPTNLPFDFKPINWDMLTDVMIEIADDVLFLDEKLVVKNTGLKVGTNEPIGESSTEEVLVKSTVKFGVVCHPGRKTNIKAGDVVSFNGANVKPIDFDKKYCVIPHFAIYGKIGSAATEPATTTNSPNLLGRILQGFRKWLGIGNVHKQ